MGVSDEDGHLVVSTHYLRTGKRRDIYLDVIHELVHVRQFREGKELFPEGFEYPRILEALREQLLALPELSDVDELVDDIEIDIPPLARSEIVRRDDQVAVLVAHAHVPPLGGEELHPQALEGRLRLRAENGSDGRQVL